MTMNNTNPLNIEKDELCAVCKIATRRKCGNCKNVYYCSREHQKSDWKEHSKICPVMTLVEDPTIGHRYIATRTIKVDEIVFREEKPLFVTVCDEWDCLNCYASCSDRILKNCKKCGWFLCSKCTRHGPECELTMRYRKKKIVFDDNSAPSMHYNVILVLRAIFLRENNPEAYQKFMNLGNRCIGVGTSSRSFELSKLEWQNNARKVKEFMKIDDVAEEEIFKMIEIAGLNEILVTENDYRYVAFYEKLSYIEHNCRANCYKVFGTDGGIVIRAAMEIPKGHPITISYLNELDTTTSRRFTLRLMKHVDCICERCSDPTELGTMFNAVKCIKKDCAGYMLPSTFLVPEEQTIPDYVCDKCNARKRSSSIDKMIKKIKERFFKMSPLDMNQIMKFIVDQKEVLHENHSCIFLAKFILAISFCQTTGFSLPVSEDLLKQHMMLCKELTKRFETLMPAQFNKRGTILYVQWLSMDELRDKQNPSQTEYRREIKESLDVLTEAYRLLSHEPSFLFPTGLLEKIAGQLDVLSKFHRFLTTLPTIFEVD